MPKKERVTNEHKNMPFFISRLEKAILRTEENILEVWLKKDGFIDASRLNERGLVKDAWLEKLRVGKNPGASFVRGQMKKTGEIVIADEDHPIRWVGAGGLLMLRDKKGVRHAVLNKRHPLSSWGGYIDANGGYSSSIKDMCLPGTLGEREMAEEVILKYKGKRIPLKISPRYVERTVSAVVHFKGQTFTTPDLILVIDPDTGVVDFRRVYEMDIDDIADYSFEDGETRLTGENKEVSQGREIFVLELNDLISGFKKGKDKFTPVLSAILERL